MQREYTDRNDNVYTIHALTQSRMLATVRALRKKGMVISSNDGEFEKGLEFQLALAKACCTSVRFAGKDSDASARDREDWIENTPGAAAFVLARASELAEEAAKMFEVESGN